MKILLISANTLKTPYPVYPLGLDYVAGAIAGAHDVRILDMNDPDGQASLVETLVQYAPDLVGLSLRNIDSTEKSDQEGFIGAYANLMKTIRKLSKAPVVLGGSGFSLFPDELMKALGADYGIVGEGERFPELLQSLNKDQPAPCSPGILKRGFAASIPPPWTKPLTLDFAQPKPHRDYYVKHGGMLNLQTKRGCSFRCIYCTYPHIEGRVLRFTAPVEAADTAMRLQKSGAAYLFITDSVFNSNIQHSLEVAEAFIRAGLSIPWGAFFAPTQTPKGYFKRLRAAGLTHVEFGTESLSAAMLKTYKKPFVPVHVVETHRQAVEEGLHVAHYLLLGGPGENHDTVEETLSQAETLNRSVFFFFALCVFIRIRNSTAWPSKRGLLPRIKASFDLFFTGRRKSPARRSFSR